MKERSRERDQQVGGSDPSVGSFFFIFDSLALDIKSYYQILKLNRIWVGGGGEVGNLIDAFHYFNVHEKNYKTFHFPLMISSIISFAMSTLTLPLFTNLFTTSSTMSFEAPAMMAMFLACNAM